MRRILLITITFIVSFHSANAQWYQVNTNTTENLYDMFFVDSLEGYCVGGSDYWGTPQSTGVILKTIDGGENWTTIFSIDSLTIKNIAVVDVFGNKKLYAFGKNGASYLVSTVINTPFQNWSVNQISYLPFEMNIYNNGIFFLDHLNGGLKKIENGIITTLLSTGNISLFDVSQVGLLYLNVSADSIIADDFNGNITTLPQHPIHIIGNNQLTYASIMQNGDTIVIKGTYPSAVVYSMDLGGNWNFNYGGGEGKSLILETGQIISLDLSSNQIFTTTDFGQNWEVDVINGVVFTQGAEVRYSKHNGSVFVMGENGVIYKNLNLSTVGINETDLKKKINIFPNPAKDVLQIEVSDDTEIGGIELFDIEGKRVKIFNKIDTSLNISALSSGTYFLKFSTGEGVLIKKVVIE